MERTLISEAVKKIGRPIKILGWIDTIRDQGGINFLILRDPSGIIQVVVTKRDRKIAKTVSELTSESVIELVGEVKKEKQAPGGVEIKPKQIKILSLASSDLPILVAEKAKTQPSLEKRMNWRWLDLRKPKNQLIFKVWTVMEQAFREYWLSHGYIQIHTPKLMSAPSESGAELFEVQYFNHKAYLAQSPQFYKQMAMAAGFEKVFEVGPVFRATPSFTPRHDTEFTMYDVEISFISSHYDIMSEEEEMLKAVIGTLKRKYGKKIKEEFGRDLIIPPIPFPKMTMKEAKSSLFSFDIPTVRPFDLSPQEEKGLSRIVKEKYGHEFVFVTDYPVEARPFYHMRSEKDPKITKSFDLLWNGIEITTGAQREHRLEVLTNQAREKGLNLDSLKYYLNFFKYGCPPHGGCAIGPTRMLMKIFGIDNVREVTYLYRGVNRLTP